MPNAEPEAIDAKSHLRSWSTIVGSFAVASGVQILFYGAPALLGFDGYHVPRWLYEPMVLSFFFAPAVVALIFSLRLLGSATRQAGRRLTFWPVVTLAVLAILSAYIGVVVSFNSWGT